MIGGKVWQNVKQKKTNRHVFVVILATKKAFVANALAIIELEGNSLHVSSRMTWKEPMIEV
jgi:hypothetical protein